MIDLQKVATRQLHPATTDFDIRCWSRLGKERLNAVNQSLKIANFTWRPQIVLSIRVYSIATPSMSNSARSLFHVKPFFVDFKEQQSENAIDTANAKDQKPHRNDMGIKANPSTKVNEEPLEAHNGGSSPRMSKAMGPTRLRERILNSD